jgi:uncharacterized protein YjbJ (UPF0337 family)
MIYDIDSPDPKQTLSIYADCSARILEMNDDESKGTAKDAIGKVKDGAEGLTGDAGLQIDGKIDQAEGNFQRKFGYVKDSLSEAARNAGHKASDLAGHAASTLNDVAGTARRRSGQAGEYVGDAVQQQPLLSLIGAAAIGYFVGFLIHSAASPLSQPRESSPRRYLPR